MISEKLQKEREVIVSLFRKMPEYLGHRYPEGWNFPTEAQFIYALKFGIDMRCQTFKSTSAAIDKAKADGIPAHDMLTYQESAELYRYMCRSNNRRYNFLDDIPDSPWLDPRRFKPVPAENMKNKTAFCEEEKRFASAVPSSAPVGKVVLTPEQQKQANWGCFIFTVIFLLVLYSCTR